MTSRPILFQSDMVLAILANLKGQTRRIVKPTPSADTHEILHEQGLDWREWFPLGGNMLPKSWSIRCPYGQPGDQLWVKETFFPVHRFKHYPLFAAIDSDHLYRADYAYREDDKERHSVIGCHHWKPSIFMPREASRITLSITAVRCQRLQDITAEDAIAEGIRIEKGAGAIEGQDCYMMTTNSGYMRGKFGAIAAYQDLWNSINLDPKPVYQRDSEGKKFIASYVSYPWSMADFENRYRMPYDDPTGTRQPTWRGKPLLIIPNPYVWAITFTRI